MAATTGRRTRVRPIRPARHRIPVKLKKGPNAVLIKIVNGNDPHGFYFALTSEEEGKAGK